MPDEDFYGEGTPLGTNAFGNATLASTGTIPDMEEGDWGAFVYSANQIMGLNDIMTGNDGMSINSVPSQFGAASVKGLEDDGGIIKLLTTAKNAASDFFGTKEGRNVAGMGILGMFKAMGDKKYRDANMKYQQQTGDAAQSRELRAAENAKSAGLAFQNVPKPTTPGFAPAPYVPFDQRKKVGG
jgi:hypothetical protein